MTTAAKKTTKTTKAAKKGAATAAPSSRLPLKDFLALRQADAELKNYELAEKMGYDNATIVAMIRAGTMAFPIKKVSVTAKALGLDPVFLLRRVMEDRNPELLEVMDEILGNQMINSDEKALLDFIREETGGVEFNYKNHAAFIEGIRPLLANIATRENATQKASVEALKRNYKPGPKKAATGA